MIWPALIYFLCVSHAAAENDLHRCSCLPQPTSMVSSSSHVVCSCDRVSGIPANLTAPLWALSISMSDMKILRTVELKPYRKSLRDLTLSRMKELQSIENDAFSSMEHLRTIDISRAPQLKKIDPAVFSCALPHLRTLRIIHSGLEKIPYLNELKTDYPLHTIDLESNNLMKISCNAVKVRAEEMLLSWNMIRIIEKEAFQGSQIAKLVLKGNWPLEHLHPEAFLQLHSLRKLDLSQTSITELPTAGLTELEVLMVQNTQTLKTFPSIYKFKSIEEAWLTYPYHCCAFQFPETHSPDDYAKHQEFILMMERRCEERGNELGPPADPHVDWGEAVEWGAPLRTPHYPIMDGWMVPEEHNRLPREAYPPGNTSLGGTSHVRASWGDISHHNGSTVDNSGPEYEETFHEVGVTVTSIHVTCGNLSKNYHAVRCLPSPDAFNPCEDLMGNWALRVAVWAVAIAALVGNLAVLLVLVSSTFRMTVPKFLMCNLAAADLCMGLYLLLIAATDARSVGEYFNYAIDWQSGGGCQVAGFLTVLASELSIFTLAVITSERWYTITYAIHLNKRLKLKTAAQIMAGGWVYSLIMATLPLVGVSSYSKTSICLPLESQEMKDMAYLVTLLIFNGLAFSLICACYARMYGSIRGGQDAVQARSDMTVAKRMALLVFTDFACWAPITFFGLTALAGYPLIDVPKTKILLVFFYPLNSCANPYLYALLTKQYRRDLFILLSRYGVCSERAAKYKGAMGSKPRGNTEEVACHASGKGPEGPHRGSLLTSLTYVDNVNFPAKPALGPVHEYSLELLPTQPSMDYSLPAKCHSDVL